MKPYTKLAIAASILLGLAAALGGFLAGDWRVGAAALTSLAFGATAILQLANNGKANAND